MKKAFIILLFLSALFVIKTNAQTVGVPDTLAYLKTIVTNKAQFIGKPFSVLMDSLKIQIKFFSPYAAIHYDTSKETSTSFAFYFPQTAEGMYLTYPSLRISWQPYLNAIQSRLLYSQYRTVGWAPEVANFYATGIISDISILE